VTELAETELAETDAAGTKSAGTHPAGTGAAGTDPAGSGMAGTESAGARPNAAPFAAGAAGIVDRCAAAARRRGDQLSGTAAPVSRWLLIEHPGPWGRDALRQSGLRPEVAAAVADRAAASRVRVVLIRRCGRVDRAGARRVGWVDSRPGHERLSWGTWADERDLLELRPDQPAGEPDPDPAYLVCAHGRHDACCAIWGRPVAATLASLRPAAVWECTHVGGDRFAANVIALPHGFYYGGVVTPADAGALVSRYEAGLVEPDLLRGRSVFPPAVQVAQQHARRALAEYGVDALPPLDVAQVAPGTTRVLLAHRDGVVTVTVRAERSPAARLTCAAGKPETARVFRLVELEPPVPADSG